MAIPNQASIQLPLLLEVERAGGNVRPRDVYQRLEKHFPDLTEADKLIRRPRAPRAFVWENLVNWARNSLREQGHMGAEQWGVWQITPEGGTNLRSLIAQLGIPDAELFIASNESLPDAAGHTWKPQPVNRRKTPTGPELQKEVQGLSPELLGTEQRLTKLRTAGSDAEQTGARVDIEAQLLSKLRALTPRQFEAVVAGFLQANGVSHVEVTGQTSDGGIDAIGEILFVDIKVAVQAKRYAEGNNVGIEPVQRLRGSMASGFDRGVFITTSNYSPAARGWVEETNAPIALIDGESLAKEMVELGLGVQAVPMVEHKLDEDFFSNLGI